MGKNVNKSIDSNILLQRLNAWRILFALEIIIGHVVRYETFPINLVGRFMIISVAYFLFVSALGMTLSYKKKGQTYLNRFLIKKPLYILVIGLLSFGINYLIDLIIGFDLGYNRIESNVFVHIFYYTNWYVWELILLYLVFFISFRLIRSDLLKCLVVLLISVILMIYSFFQLFQGWYASILAFPLGVFIGLFYDRIGRCAVFCTGVALSFVGMLSFIFTSDGLVEMVLLRNSMCLGAMLLFFWINQYVNIDCRVFRKLSPYTTELYLYQFVMLKISDHLDMPWSARLAIVMLGTVALCLCIHPVNRLISRLCR